MKEQSMTTAPNDSTPPTDEDLAFVEALDQRVREAPEGSVAWQNARQTLWTLGVALLPRLARAHGALLADLRDAAGELLVDIPEPGTVVSKLLLANVLMRRERERLRAERDTALAEVPARLKAEREAAALYGALDSASKDGAQAVAAAHARGRREAIKEAAAHLVGEEQSRAAAMIMAFEDALRTKRGPS